MDDKRGNIPRTDRVVQQRLLHYSPREVCEEFGIRLEDSADLYAEGILSFNLSEGESLEETQEDELRFVGALRSSGLSTDCLQRLLRDLEFPYCYSHSDIYYNWPAQSWARFTPRLSDMTGGDVVEWLEARLDEGNVELLSTVIKEATVLLSEKLSELLDES